MDFNNASTRKDISEILDIPLSTLTYVLYKDSAHLYKSFEISKKSGGSRNISAPLGTLKFVQKRLSEALQKHIQKKRPLNTVSHGFEKDKSIITNASVHRNKRFVLNIDIENFFESIHFGRVRGYFNKNNKFNLSVELATIIAQLSCHKGVLPQGAPSSPIIANLICEILDYKLLSVSKKYKLNYTRYADDISFSTNDKVFETEYSVFLEEIKKEILKAGFKINENKIRLQYKDSRQVVTGLIVNKKVNVNRAYFKKTKAMAYSLYTKGEFEIDGVQGHIKQLEGRFSFINSIKYEENKKRNIQKIKSFVREDFSLFDLKEFEYQKFLFFKYFMANENPLIMTEGKTDIVYLRIGLKKYYKDYPNLIEKKPDGTFKYKVSFLNRTPKMKYFFRIYLEGAASMNSVYKFYSGENKYPNLSKYFEDLKVIPKKPVILFFDNEMDEKNKPLRKFVNFTKINECKKQQLNQENIVNLSSNLYLMTVPLVDGKKECEIEDLFYDDIKKIEIRGKKFSKEKESNIDNSFGKEKLSSYLKGNHQSINFERFKKIFDNIERINKDFVEKQK